MAEEEANSVDRRRVSPESKRRIAESIHRGETDAALRELFEVLTGDRVDAWPPVRDVVGEIRLADADTLDTNRSLICEVRVGDAVTQCVVDNDGGQYRLAGVAEGEHTVAVGPLFVREYDADTLDTTRYEIDSIDVSQPQTQVDVTTETVPIDETVTVAETSIDGCTVGAKSER